MMRAGSNAVNSFTAVALVMLISSKLGRNAKNFALRRTMLVSSCIHNDRNYPYFLITLPVNMDLKSPSTLFIYILRSEKSTNKLIYCLCFIQMLAINQKKQVLAQATLQSGTSIKNRKLASNSYTVVAKRTTTISRRRSRVISNAYSRVEGKVCFLFVTFSVR